MNISRFQPVGCLDFPALRVLACWLAGWTLVFAARAAPINPPIGPYTHPDAAELAKATRFGTNSPVVLTSYFYWYDSYTQAHLIDADGTDALTDHPPTLTDFSYKSTAWHRTQLEDMIAAGIDVALPVYWGEPSQRIPGKPALEQPWSFAGLPPLVQARDALLAEGKRPPAIGMFYDTSTLQYNAAGTRIDLTTDYGRRWFYESIRDFFSLIPARHWATIEGRPIIFLYSAGFATAHDQSCIDYVRQEFAQDFSGVDPYIVREISWNVKADNTYAWGGAISLRNPGVAALGPGYDHSAVPGREPLVVPRENGAFFERQWTRFLRAPSKLVHIETWDEFHEGTDIAASKEYGRQYIELNRKFADLFKAGIRPPRPRGPYSDAKSVSVALQATNEARGLTQFEFADGATVPAEAGGRACRVTAPTSHAGRYIYFQIDDSFKWADDMLVDVEVEYFDQGTGSFRIEYDGPDPNAPFNGAYTASKTAATLANSGQWKTAKFRLLGARFLNSQNGGADFRIAVQADPFYVRRVTVSRLGVPAEAGQTLHGWQPDFSEPLGTNWIVVGAAPDVFRSRSGMLQFGPATVRPTCLLAEPPGLTRSGAEVLTRIRPVNVSAGLTWPGGVAMVADAQSGDGFAAAFRYTATGQPELGLSRTTADDGPVAAAAWEVNRWYWLRVRHQTNSAAGYPDLWLRCWPADGETPEPGAWTLWRDYYPANAAASGLPGLVAGAGVFEVDYFLVKSDALPEIVAQLPALKPARAHLEPRGFSPVAGMQIEVLGEPDTSYVLEHSSDLEAWEGAVVTTDAAGETAFQDAATNLPRRFYRARVAQ